MGLLEIGIEKGNWAILKGTIGRSHWQAACHREGSYERHDGRRRMVEKDGELSTNLYTVYLIKQI